MKKQILLLVAFLNFLSLHLSCAQHPPLERPHCLNPAFDSTIDRLLRFSVPLIGVEELNNIRGEVLIFDTRKPEEHEISHIPAARYIGFSDFRPQSLAGVPKDVKIVLFCSVGYRSEKIGEKLKALGYTRVYNLYGGMFEWVNRGYPIVDRAGMPARKIHTYNADWSPWVTAEDVEKIW